MFNQSIITNEYPFSAILRFKNFSSKDIISGKIGVMGGSATNLLNIFIHCCVLIRIVLATLANEDEISLRRFNTANIVSNEYELFFRAKEQC